MKTSPVHAFAAVGGDGDDRVAGCLERLDRGVDHAHARFLREHRIERRDELHRIDPAFARDERRAERARVRRGIVAGDRLRIGVLERLRVCGERVAHRVVRLVFELVGDRVVDQERAEAGVDRQAALGAQLGEVLGPHRRGGAVEIELQALERRFERAGVDFAERVEHGGCRERCAAAARPRSDERHQHVVALAHDAARRLQRDDPVAGDDDVHRPARSHPSFSMMLRPG